MSNDIQEPYIRRFQDPVYQKFLCIVSQELGRRLAQLETKEGSSDLQLKQYVYKVMHDLSDMKKHHDWEESLIYGNDEINKQEFAPNMNLYSISVTQSVGGERPRLIFAGPFSSGGEFNLPHLFFFNYAYEEDFEEKWGDAAEKMKTVVDNIESANGVGIQRENAPDRRGFPVPTHSGSKGVDWKYIDKVLKSERVNIRLNSIGQMQAITALAPVLINGQAGSGKTTVLIHKMVWSVLQHRKKLGGRAKVLYISYSERLKTQAYKDANDIIEIIHGESKEVHRDNMEFEEMRQLLKHEVGNPNLFSDANHVSLGIFKDWYQKTHAKDHHRRNIPAERAWSAIRLLKGRIDAPHRYPGGKIGEEEIVTCMKEDKLLFRWAQSDKEHQAKILLSYQEWIQGRNGWDDLDLARRAHKELTGDSRHRTIYHEIFCDEAQDFTQIELAYLKEKCSKNPMWPTKFGYCLNLAGDDMQTINPTGFDWNAFLDSWEKDAALQPNLIYLSQNERSDRKIVKLANRFLEVQKNYFLKEIEMQTGNDFAEDLPIFVIDDEGIEIEEIVSKWVTQSISRRDQNIGIIIDSEYEKEVVEFLETDSLFRTIFDSKIAEEIFVKIGKKDSLNLKQAMRQVSNTTGEAISEDEKYSENEKMNLLYTLLQKLRVYRVSDIKGLEREKILLHRMVQTETGRMDEKEVKRFEKLQRRVADNLDLPEAPLKPMDPLKESEELDLQHRLNRHYIAVSRAMRKLLILEGGKIANDYWKPIAGTSLTNTIDNPKILEGAINENTTWWPKEKKFVDFRELFKFAMQLRDAAGKDGISQRIRAIAVLQEALEAAMDDVGVQRDRELDEANEEILKLEGEVSKMQGDYQQAGECFESLAGRIFRRDNRREENTGITHMEEAGNCFRRAEAWGQARRVYGEILEHGRILGDGQKLRARIWEQDCKFRMAVEKAEKNEMWESVLEYWGFLENLDEKEWEGLGTDPEKIENVVTLARTATSVVQEIYASDEENPITDIFNSTKLLPRQNLLKDCFEICYMAAVKLPWDENKTDQSVQDCFNFGVLSDMSNQDSGWGTFELISTWAGLRYAEPKEDDDEEKFMNKYGKYKNTEIFSSQQRGTQLWYKYTIEWMESLIEDIKSGEKNLHEKYTTAKLLCREYNRQTQDIDDEELLDIEGWFENEEENPDYHRIVEIHDKLKLLNSGKWGPGGNWPPEHPARLYVTLDNHGAEVGQLNRSINNYEGEIDPIIKNRILTNFAKRWPQEDKGNVRNYEYSLKGGNPDPYQLYNADKEISYAGIQKIRNHVNLAIMMADHIASFDQRRAMFWYIEIEKASEQRKDWFQMANALYLRGQLHEKIWDRFRDQMRAAGESSRLDYRPHMLRAYARSAFYFMWSHEDYAISDARKRAKQAAQEARKMSNKLGNRGGNMAKSAIRLYSAVLDHLGRNKIDSELITRYKQCREANWDGPAKFSEKLELSMLDADLDAESIINNYFENRDYSSVVTYLNHNPKLENIELWKARLMAKSAHWVEKAHGGQGRIDFCINTHKWIKNRFAQLKIRDNVIKEYSAEDWAKILRLIQIVFKVDVMKVEIGRGGRTVGRIHTRETMDRISEKGVGRQRRVFDVTSLLDFLTEYIIQGEEWAKKMYREVGKDERQRLLNEILIIEDKMNVVADLLAKKEMELQIEGYKEQIEEIEQSIDEIDGK